MKIDCHQPYGTGDKGQRFEVTFFDPERNCRRTLGWCETAEGAQQMADGVEKHPSWQFPQILDRSANK